MEKHILFTLKGSAILLCLFSLGFSGVFAQNQLKIVDNSGKKIWSIAKAGPLTIQSKDTTKNLNPKEKEGISIRVISETEPEGETFMMMETAENSSLFVKNVDLVEADKPIARDGKLQIGRGDKITVLYTEALTSNAEPQHFDEAFFKGPGWTFDNTGENHIMLVPDYAVITIDGKPIEKGDFLGVFYQSEKDGKKVQVNGSGTGRDTAPGGVCWKGVTAATAIWGAPQGKKNGFSAGEGFQWKIWRASDGKMFDAVAEYLEGQNFPDKGSYVKDGISGLKKLTAVSPK